MVNFGQSTIKECNFNNVNILCYEKYTCDLIYFNKKIITGNEAENEFKICSKKEIEDKKKDTSLKYLIGSTIFVLIIALLTFILIEKEKFKKFKKNEFRGSIYIKLNEHHNNNNNNNNVITEINNNDNVNTLINDNNNANTEIINNNIEIVKSKDFIYVAEIKNNNYNKKMDKSHDNNFYL